MFFNSYMEKHGDILSVEGTKATKENILNGKYKLSTTYYLTVDENGSQAVMDFVKYCLSDQGKDVINKNFIHYAD